MRGAGVGDGRGDGGGTVGEKFAEATPVSGVDVGRGSVAVAGVLTIGPEVAVMYCTTAGTPGRVNIKITPIITSSTSATPAISNGSTGVPDVGLAVGGMDTGTSTGAGIVEA